MSTPWDTGKTKLRTSTPIERWSPSRREYFAAAALTGLAAWSPYQSDSVGLTAEETAKEAVNTADALIRELAKEPQE